MLPSFAGIAGGADPALDGANAIGLASNDQRPAPPGESSTCPKA